MTASSDGRRTSQRVRLPDGRRLGFAEYGPPDGVPVMAFHGIPGSRLLGSPDDQAVGPLRLIGVDRPGFGLSDYQRRRRLLDWPRDVAALADALNLERFAVLGGSAGGPYALACAYAMPDRLTTVAVVNGMAPFDRPRALAGYKPLLKTAWWSLRMLPGSCTMVAWMQYRLVRRDPEQLLRKLTSRMSASDRAAALRPEVRRVMLAQIKEAYRQGWRGMAQDLRIVTGTWGFRLQDC